jgi:hypothetical protein
MALPKAIQKQVDDADAFVAQMTGQTDNTETDPNLAPNPASAPEPPQLPISQEPEPKPTIPEETWERKYLTLKGMYDAEVPRLHAQMREMNGQVQQLIAENATARVQQTVTQPSTAKTLITEQDKEAFGSDLLDLIDRASEQKVAEFRSQNAHLVSRIEELQGKLGNVTERQVVSDKDKFLANLSAQVPNWETLNIDQGFLAWLAEVDPVYGLPRQVALTNAYESLDANRTAIIFNQYQGKVAPMQQKPSQQLQSQVAPTRSRASPAPATSAGDKSIWSQDQIANFYNEWIKGHLDQAEAERIEKDINAAYAEGRIR